MYGADRFVKIGTHIVNLDAVSSVHWEQDKLYVHQVGGRFLTLGLEEGRKLWEHLENRVEGETSKVA